MKDKSLRGQAVESVLMGGLFFVKVPFDVGRNAIVSGSIIRTSQEFNVAFYKQFLSSRLRSSFFCGKSLAAGWAAPDNPMLKTSIIWLLTGPCKYYENPASVQALRASQKMPFLPHCQGLRLIGLEAVIGSSAVATTCGLVITDLARDYLENKFPDWSSQATKQVASLSVGILSTIFSKPLDAVRVQQVKKATVIGDRLNYLSFCAMATKIAMAPRPLARVMKALWVDVALTGFAFYLVQTAKDWATPINASINEFSSRGSPRPGDY